MISFEGSVVEKVAVMLARIVGLLFLLMGLAFLIAPEVIGTVMFVEPMRAVGVNSLRSDFAALFLGMSFFCLLGSSRAFRSFLLVPIVFLTIIVCGRLVSWVVDDVPMVYWGALSSELIFLAILGALFVCSPPNTSQPKNLSYFKAIGGPKLLKVIGLVSIIAVVALAARKQIGWQLWKNMAGRGMLNDRFSAFEDGLHVGLAGTGSPMPDARRRGGCSFVLAGKQLFIVDSGPGSTLMLELMRVPLYKTQAVLLTHLHSDHMADLGELMLKSWTTGARTEPLTVMGPSGVDKVVDGFNLAFEPDSYFRHAHHGRAVAPQEGSGGRAETINGFDEAQSKVIFQADGVTVTAFLVEHRPADPALGYRFDYKGRSLVISGDTLPSETLRRQSQNVDLLLHEVLNPEFLHVINQAAKKNGRTVIEHVAYDILDYHTFPEEVARIASDAKVRSLVFHHLIPPIPAAILQPAFLGETKAIYDGPVDIGVEGMVFSMPSESTKIVKKWIL